MAKSKQDEEIRKKIPCATNFCMMEKSETKTSLFLNIANKQTASTHSKFNELSVLILKKNVITKIMPSLLQVL